MKPILVLVLMVAAAGSERFASAQVDYTADGSPTGLEEEIRWRLNRGRFDSAAENQARGTNYTDIPASTGPLAPHQSLTLAARHQAEDMAKNNLLTHDTLAGSLYYNAITYPKFWNRMTAEGYAYTTAGENIACGYANAEAVYLGWWNSTLHRQNMYNSALREIGNGYYYWSASDYDRYYTMDLGSRGTNTFFTDTVFSDVNGNGVYDQGEGVAGVRITLVVNGTVYTNADTSASAGSFAIPITSIGGGTSVQVVLSNTTAKQVTFTIPQNYQATTAVTLASYEGQPFGTFTDPTNVVNVGWRNVTPLPPIVRPTVVLTKSGQDVVLGWPSDIALEYLPQRSANLLQWSNVTERYGVGTGSNLTYRDRAPGSSNGFYRLLIRRR